MTDPQWLAWARRLQALAQSGLTFSRDQYDIERYEEIRTIAAAMVAAGAGADFGAVRDLFTLDTGYTTPKVDVRAAIFRDDGILLVRERSDGMWTLPGGWADVGDTPAQAVEREVLEETGYRARAAKLLAVYDRTTHGHPPIPFAVYKLYFLCEITGGAAAATHETDEVGFFREDALPPLSLTRTLPAQVARLFQHHRHPEWPTDFD
jgi:ADP-ribose pyrophosphatase YjhB (NUDIX family)